MSQMTCDCCGVDLTSWSVRYGGNKTTFCKKCYETDAANKIVEERATTPREEALTSENVTHKLTSSNKQELIITDFNMPFGSMVIFIDVLLGIFGVLNLISLISGWCPVYHLAGNSTKNTD